MSVADRGRSFAKPSPGVLRRGLHGLVAGGFWLLRVSVRALPASWVGAIGGTVGELAHLLDWRHRRVARDNVRLALPELDRAERRRVVRSSFRNLATVICDSLAAGALDRDELRARYEIEGWEHLEAAEAPGHGVLLISAHLGDWEAAGRCLALHGKPIGMLARPMTNSWMERQVRSLRERFGNFTIPKRRGTRTILRTLHAAGRVAMLIDQRVHPDEGDAFDFFGRPAHTSPLPARLSLKTGAPVVPFFGIPLDDRGRCRVELREPIWPRGTAERSSAEPAHGTGRAAAQADRERLTRQYLAVLEDEIRRRPGLWLWAHRRWRKNPAASPR